jgi:hypothetical protein
MTCEHYWQDGIERAERGEHDSHRERCDDCRRAHRLRDQIVRALVVIGATRAVDPDWQARVWHQIARERVPPS